MVYPCTERTVAYLSCSPVQDVGSTATRCDSGGPPSGDAELPGITQLTPHSPLIYDTIAHTSTAAVTAESMVGTRPGDFLNTDPLTHYDGALCM